MGGGGKAATAADKASAQVESRKTEIMKEQDAFVEKIEEGIRPLKEKALEAYKLSGKSKEKLGGLEVEQAKKTTGIMSDYFDRTKTISSARQQALFSALENKPTLSPVDSSRISRRMAQLESLFGGM